MSMNQSNKNVNTCGNFLDKFWNFLWNSKIHIKLLVKTFIVSSKRNSKAALANICPKLAFESSLQVHTAFRTVFLPNSTSLQSKNNLKWVVEFVIRRTRRGNGLKLNEDKAKGPDTRTSSGITLSSIRSTELRLLL